MRFSLRIFVLGVDVSNYLVYSVSEYAVADRADGFHPHDSLIVYGMCTVVLGLNNDGKNNCSHAPQDLRAAIVSLANLVGTLGLAGGYRKLH